MKKFNPINKSYIDVDVDLSRWCYVDEQGNRLFRIETKGRTGKVQYRNAAYLNDNGREFAASGMGGSTGHGWGGSIIGYATEADLEGTNIR